MFNRKNKKITIFTEANQKAQQLAQLIETQHDQLVDVLLKYESFEVATDEIDRSLDLLQHLQENEAYFTTRTGSVASFLPRNQPLYAFTCFVIVPSLMANEVHFRIPHTMKHFFGEVLDMLQIADRFPNVHVSAKERLDFLKEQSALLEDPATKETIPATSVVIFTGTMANADKLRLVFDKRTLFISNGSGHNPVVVSEDADLAAAVQAVTTLQFYNQGQDCAAPNAVLVHSKVIEPFLELLRAATSAVKVGAYQDKSCRVGPISEASSLVSLEEFFVKKQAWLDPSTPGIINTRESTVAPTIIRQPLSLGGNFREIFAPVIFVQEYQEDQELQQYFENAHYAENAMYVTLYGTSAYTQSLVNKTIGGKILHDESTFLHNTHLHAPGVERGTQPYGGYGLGASSLSLNGQLTAKPTLPQRDIYELLVRPVEGQEPDTARFSHKTYKNIEKLLRFKTYMPQHIEIAATNTDSYVDLKQVTADGVRYAKVSQSELYNLLSEPNGQYATTLEAKDIAPIQSLLPLLQTKASLSFEEFQTQLYAIPKQADASDDENKQLQRQFFQNIYQLLFGASNGPRLAEFFWDMQDGDADKLLAVVNDLG